MDVEAYMRWEHERIAFEVKASRLRRELRAKAMATGILGEKK